MLRAPDKRARNLLDLANLIEGLNPGHFDMKHWNSCICGHYLRSRGVTYGFDDWQGAARRLGLTYSQGSELFAPKTGNSEVHEAMSYTPKQAAERIRKFAFAMMD